MTKTPTLAAVPTEVPEAEETPPLAGPMAMTAFLVIVGHDGTVVATGDLESPITVEREATMGDFRRACQEVVFDVNNAMVSDRTMLVLHQMAQAAQQQSDSQRIAQRLQGQGITVPGR